MSFRSFYLCYYSAYGNKGAYAGEYENDCHGCGFKKAGDTFTWPAPDENRR
jgi:hypothetical protein